MNVSVLLGRQSYSDDPGVRKLVGIMENEGDTVEFVTKDGGLDSGTDLLLSVGGDGTFLSAAAMASEKGIPVLGMNLGRLGFLSENTPEDVLRAFPLKRWRIEDRPLLCASVENRKFVALNDIVARRSGPSMLGTTVIVDGRKLPTYWADGLIVSTPSGSTAYSLSAGGPIVDPRSEVLLIVPVAPHNLNVRPLIVPSNSRVEMRFESREPSVQLSHDNNSLLIPVCSSVSVSLSSRVLRRVCLDSSNFINALSEKLFWGEDKRNEK